MDRIHVGAIDRLFLAQRLRFAGLYADQVAALGRASPAPGPGAEDGVPSG